MENNKDLDLYIVIINNIGKMVSEHQEDETFQSVKECYGKLGLYASAKDFLCLLENVRKSASNNDVDDVRAGINAIAMVALQVISLYMNTEPIEIVKSQVELYKLKNRRYGNSFAECFAKDGYPYAFGHLQEKVNRICSLLMIGDEAKDEPILDSYKDLLGYCILTIKEILIRK